METTKAEGNAHFRDGKFDVAELVYTEALELLDRIDGSLEKLAELKALVLSNRSATSTLEVVIYKNEGGFLNQEVLEINLMITTPSRSECRLQCHQWSIALSDILLARHVWPGMSEAQKDKLQSREKRAVDGVKVPAFHPFSIYYI